MQNLCGLRLFRPSAMFTNFLLSLFLLIATSSCVKLRVLQTGGSDTWQWLPVPGISTLMELNVWISRHRLQLSHHLFTFCGTLCYWQEIKSESMMTFLGVADIVFPFFFCSSNLGPWLSSISSTRNFFLMVICRISDILPWIRKNIRQM